MGAHHLVANNTLVGIFRDRDTKYTSRFDAVFGATGTRILKTPFKTPNANAYAERFVRIIRSECLDHLLVLNEHHLERVLRSYAQHYNGHRPHQGISQEVPAVSSENRFAILAAEEPGCGGRFRPMGGVLRRDRLGGLIHEYELAA